MLLHHVTTHAFLSAKMLCPRIFLMCLTVFINNMQHAYTLDICDMQPKMHIIYNYRKWKQMPTSSQFWKRFPENLFRKRFPGKVFQTHFPGNAFRKRLSGNVFWKTCSGKWFPTEKMSWKTFSGTCVLEIVLAPRFWVSVAACQA